MFLPGELQRNAIRLQDGILGDRRNASERFQQENELAILLPGRSFRPR